MRQGPREIDQAVASVKLSAMGIRLDSLTEGLTAYITTGDIVYMCHSAFNAEDRADAEKIIHDWAESLK